MTPNRRLKQARELRGWSQAKVAEQIGTDATTVSRWERGLFSPTPYFRERLCALFSKNAEELGLLESCQPSAREQNGPSIEPLATISSFREKERRSREGSLLDKADSSTPAPSWHKRTDTFAYILHSAAHDQQAHMLWEDAYVRALRGQYLEAQRLGAASLNEFERVGHMNAGAVREWLTQQDQASSSSTPNSVPSSMSLPTLTDQHQRPVRRLMRRKGAGIVMILLFSLTALLAGFSFSQLYPVALASPLFSRFSASASNANSSSKGIASSNFAHQAAPTPAATPKPAATSRPVATLAPTVAPTPTSAPTLDLIAEVEPTTLHASDCTLEPQLGYLCTIKLRLYTSTEGNFNWDVANCNLPATFNPSHGTGQVGGQPVEIIVYIASSPGQQGMFTFALTVSQTSKMISVNWLG